MKTMTNTYNHAKRELDILTETASKEDRPIIEPFIPELLAIAEKFGLNGDSGGSAPYVAAALGQAVKALCLQEPIGPITGQESEWVDVYESSEGRRVCQNNRCSAVFKEGEGQPYYLNAIMFQGEGQHDLFTGMVEGITSRQFIRLPFTPKTFYINVRR